VAVSPKYAVGEYMKDIEVPVESKKVILAQSQIDSTRCKESCTIGSIFYWYCRLCKVTNEFIVEMCKNCKQRRAPGTQQVGIPSCLLEIVENICVVSNANTVNQENKIIDQSYIPQNVIRSVEGILRGDYMTAKKLVNMSSPLSYDSIFHWKCSHCTVDNSYRRWSCNVCKRKVSQDYADT
jgi:hypothetical protein